MTFREQGENALLFSCLLTTKTNEQMKRTTLLRRCTWISVASAFALAWVNYWVAFAAFVCAGIFATAWLVSDYADYANKND